MYSKNDYRYYLEDQLIHSDDFLAHYGVKGMKWKKHKTGGLKDVFDLMGQNSRKLLSDPKNATKDVRNVVNDIIYYFHTTTALTAGEYDALDLTAQAYDNYELTAYDYDFNGKNLLV